MDEFLVYLFICLFVVHCSLLIARIISSFAIKKKKKSFFITMSSPLRRFFTKARIKQAISDWKVREQNAYRFTPQGPRHLIFKVMFGMQFSWYCISWTLWRRKLNLLY